MELILLPYEIFNIRSKTIKVKIGNLIIYQTFDKTRLHNDWTQFVKNKYAIYNMTNEKGISNYMCS